MMKFFIALVLICTSFLYSCSSIEYAQVNASLKGKKVGVYPFEFSGLKKKQKLNSKDSICFCAAQYASDAITPYLMNAGLTVVPLFHNEKVSFEQVLKTADSLKLDYILVGKGLVDVVGKSYFLNKLNLKLINRLSKESHFAMEYYSAGITLEKSIKKIGKKITKKFH